VNFPFSTQHCIAPSVVMGAGGHCKSRLVSFPAKDTLKEAKKHERPKAQGSLWFTARKLKIERILVGLIGVMICSLAMAEAKPIQKMPDAKRRNEIRQALISKGYDPGKDWKDTLIVLRRIAEEHHWQHHYVPDARVLILLGLGNEHSDSSILNEPLSRLEKPN